MKKSEWNKLIFGDEYDGPKPSGYWTYERCKEEALKYQTKKEFTKGCDSAYGKSRKNGWLDEICSHMILSQNPSGYWDFEKCRKAALKCKTRKEFSKKFGRGYQVANINGWFDAICGHMTECKRPNGHWNDKGNCKNEAKKYKNRSDFRNGSQHCYLKSRKNGWLDEICGHMVVLKGRITNKEILNEAKKYKRIKDFRKRGKKFYEVAQRRGILNTVCSHMQRLHQNNKWIYENCKAESLKYKIKAEFKKGSGGAYSAARKNGWLDEFFPKN